MLQLLAWENGLPLYFVSYEPGVVVSHINIPVGFVGDGAGDAVLCLRRKVLGHSLKRSLRDGLESFIDIASRILGERNRCYRNGSNIEEESTAPFCMIFVGQLSCWAPEINAVVGSPSRQSPRE